MSAKTHQDRRRFLKYLAAGLGTAALSPYLDLAQLAKAAGPRRRRHLINIVIWGGWDSAWFHNPIMVSDLTELGSLAGQYASGVAVSNSQIGFEGATFNKPFKLTYRHGDNEGQMHPTARNSQFLGLGSSTVFSRADLSRIAIWKGLKQEGQHGIGNVGIQMGMNSSYALSYTAVIADSISRLDYIRPLHYTALAATPGNLFLNAAMNTGFQVPICIADQGQLARITQTDPNDIADVSRRKAINDSIARLSGIAYSSAFRLKTSQTIASAYASSFQNALSISGADMANDPEYLYCVKRMWMAMVEKSLALFSRPDLRARQAAVGLDYTTELSQISASCPPLDELSAYRLLKTRVAANPNDATAKTELATLRASLTNSLRQIPSSNLSNNILGLAQTFGQAAFLVRQDHSAVVDLSARAGGDPHGNYLNGLIELTWSMAGYNEMVKLVAAQDDGTGNSLLDNTLIVMHTELDREQWHQPGDLFGRPVHAGTNHAETTSLYLAGMGVKGGEIIGGTHRGPKDYPRFTANAGYNYLQPLPIDWATGMPKPLSEGGRYCSTKAIFPTILKAFGAAVPLQQTTDYGALPAILT